MGISSSLRRGRTVVIATLVACVAVVGIAAAAVGGFNPFGNSKVGTQADGSVLLPTNQWITPYGAPRILDNERLVSSTLSPDGRYLAALGWNDYTSELTIVNLQTRQIVQKTVLRTTGPAGTDGSVAADGPLFSPDGSTIWVPQSAYLDKFAFNDATGTATEEKATPLCGSTGSTCTSGPTNPQGAYLPSGMALSPDGSLLYVALNGNNTLGVVDTTSGDLLNRIPVGNAPRQVVVADGGKYAYVSNEGGRPARPGEFTNLSDGTPIVADHSTGGATTGTVSVVDLASGKETQEIPVGLEPTALYQAASTQENISIRRRGSSDQNGRGDQNGQGDQNGRGDQNGQGDQNGRGHQDGATLLVANSNDDSLSVIDESTNRVTQTVRTNPVPGADVGSYANAISMPSPDRVLVSIGRDNAIAVYSYRDAHTPMRPLGLIPTDWYPVQVQPDPALGAGSVVVTNDKGIGAQGPPSTITKAPFTEPNPGPATDHNTYDDTGSVTTFGMPSDGQLSQTTHMVFTDNAWDQIKPINQGDYDTVPSVIPAHLGGSSPIKHIVVIVKENRTYDQVLGDLGQGNGDPADAQFGSQITPNFHALAQRFGNLDNFYDEGTLSADGHNWIVQAEANDYVEKEFGAFYRSYPSQGGDALAYQRDGFLWNAAQKAGLSVQNFGEYLYNPYDLPANTPRCAGPGDTTSPSIWDCFYQQSQWYEHGRQGPEPIQHPCQYTRISSDIPSLQAISDPCFPNFQMSIPDQYRVDKWLPVFHHEERTGNMPSLSFMWLMTDHTGATGVPAGSGVPYPVAQVADNDLAVGRVIDAVSHSRYWKSTAIFVDEDDTQNGVDHVDGHRAPTFVVSPYSANGVDDQYYTQLNMVKTVEQILGIRPMNQEDAAAEPMYAAFTAHPDFTPFDVQPNQIPLTLGAPGYGSTLTAPAADASAAARRDFHPQGVVPADMRGVYNAWLAWLELQDRKGLFNGPDRVNPAEMNRFDWYSAHNWSVAYPGDSKIYRPNQVPGRNLPAAFIGNR